MSDHRLTPELVIRAYSVGAFPMSSGRTQRDIQWFRPDPRAILPLDDRFHVSRSLARRVRSGRFAVTRDEAFDRVIRACAEPRPGHPETWINQEIISVFGELHRRGVAHSVEAWREGQLVGGVYGVGLGGAFFGESMFSRQTDASKVALVHLVEHLRRRGYALLDVQFTNPHLEQFGVIDLTARAYDRRLREALAMDVSWDDQAR